MIYPNGSIELNKLKRMINSKDFIVYYEENTKEPIGWDWTKDGIFHGNRYPIHNEEELISCLTKELKDEGTICYDITKEYYQFVADVDDLCSDWIERLKKKERSFVVQ